MKVDMTVSDSYFDYVRTHCGSADCEEGRGFVSVVDCLE